MNDELKQQISNLQENYDTSLKKIERLETNNKRLKSETHDLMLEISNLKLELKKGDQKKKDLERNIKQLNKFHKIQLNKLINEKYDKNKNIEKRLHDIENINISYERVFFLFGEKFGFNPCLFLETEVIFKDEKLLEKVISSIKSGYEENLEGLN